MRNPKLKPSPVPPFRYPDGATPGTPSKTQVERKVGPSSSTCAFLSLLDKRRKEVKI